MIGPKFLTPNPVYKYNFQAGKAFNLSIQTKSKT